MYRLNDLKTRKEVRAVAYVRMSTDKQEYSTVNQLAAIQQYAEASDLQITRVYEDSGKSGLSMRGRHGLRELIGSVENGNADFDKVLVYDVSRWGRFQDVDESAHYEFVCRRAGIDIVYCAEGFKFDGGPMDAVIKALKRAMAAEYSRELSVKVSAGKFRLAKLGYWQGSSPGYGLRRMLIDANGNPRTILEFGEQKFSSSERVTLVAGPKHEVDVVKRIFSDFAYRGKSEGQIAQELNQEGIASPANSLWRKHTVFKLLQSEKYIGNYVYNLKSGSRVRDDFTANDPDQWIRCDGAFEPIVDRQTFETGREIIQRRGQRFYTEQELLDALRNLLMTEGELSNSVLLRSKDMPSVHAYRNRFGSLQRSFDLVGYHNPEGHAYLEKMRAKRREKQRIVGEILAHVREAGGKIQRDPKTQFLVINNEFSVAVYVAIYNPTPNGMACWKYIAPEGSKPDLVLIGCLSPNTEFVSTYFLLPAHAISKRRFKLRENNGWHLDSFRTQKLRDLLRVFDQDNIPGVSI